MDKERKPRKGKRKECNTTRHITRSMVQRWVCKSGSNIRKYLHQSARPSVVYQGNS